MITVSLAVLVTICIQIAAKAGEKAAGTDTHVELPLVYDLPKKCVINSNAISPMDDKETEVIDGGLKWPDRIFSSSDAVQIESQSLEGIEAVTTGESDVHFQRSDNYEIELPELEVGRRSEDEQDDNSTAGGNGQIPDYIQEEGILNDSEFESEPIILSEIRYN